MKTGERRDVLSDFAAISQWERFRLSPYFRSIENGFVLRLSAGTSPLVAQYLHELVTFPNGKHDDQADSTSQALNWIKPRLFEPAILVYYREEAMKLRNGMR